MPNLQNRGQARPEEFSEAPVTGSFGGVQSELPPTEIEGIGFLDSRNIMFLRGQATVRPGYTALTAFPSGPTDPVMGITNFFNSAAAKEQVVWTPSRMFMWVPGSATWTEITGPGLTGSSSNIFSFDVVGQKLCFSQGVDKIRTWDGIAGTYVESSASAPAARYIAEIGTHLMTLDTVESGTRRPQRYRWSGAGDPTDWTSFSAGVNDNLSNLGPGTGLIKLGQYGYGFHENGIVQIVPTGVGGQPFYFIPIVNCSLGNIEPYSLAHFNREGVEMAVYLAADNVYVFNQSSLLPIGDRPMDNKRVGARTRILSDVSSAPPNTAFGFVTTSIAGRVFNAYWLVIPGYRIWVYNFDESNWTPFDYDNIFQVMGPFSKAGPPRIIDLIGTIQAQGWTPANLVSTTPFDGVALGSNNGVVGYIDFTNYSETPWNITSGYSIFGDRRHRHSLKKFRIAVYDQGNVTFTIKVSNEIGYSETQTVTIGTGSGDVKSTVLGFNVSGLRLQWIISGNANVPASFVEFCPIFDEGGEQRGGAVDNN